MEDLSLYVAKDTLLQCFPAERMLLAMCSLEDNDAIMDAYLLHCINHVSTAATLIKKNNEKLKAGASNEEDAFRDQGFTRAKVRPFCCICSNAVP